MIIKGWNTCKFLLRTLSCRKLIVLQNDKFWQRPTYSHPTPFSTHITIVSLHFVIYIFYYSPFGNAPRRRTTQTFWSNRELNPQQRRRFEMTVAELKIVLPHFRVHASTAPLSRRRIRDHQSTWVKCTSLGLIIDSTTTTPSRSFLCQSSRFSAP